MSADRSVRRLSALSTASSSRVLNLIAIADANVENDGHKKSPLFLSPAFNQSLVLKHRLRADEVDLFATRRALATKIIIPFERADLKFGGRSLFVGQKGFEDLVQEVGNYRDRSELKRDLDVMRMIEKRIKAGATKTIVSSEEEEESAPRTEIRDLMPLLRSSARARCAGRSTRSARPRRRGPRPAAPCRPPRSRRRAADRGASARRRSGVRAPATP